MGNGLSSPSFSLPYCAPIYRNEIQGTYKPKITQAFHNFIYKVRSDGEVLNASEINYQTTYQQVDYQEGRLTERVVRSMN